MSDLTRSSLAPSRTSDHNGAHNGNHNGGYNGRHHHATKKGHPVAWTVVIVLVLLIAAGGFFGFKLYQEARQVQQHEQKAISILTGFQSATSSSDLAAMTTQIPKLQSETKQARDIAEGSLWNVSSKLPYVGTDVSTLQGMTRVVDDLAQKALPTYIGTLKNLSTAKLSSSDGGVDLQPILDARAPLAKAQGVIESSYKDYKELGTPHIGMLKDAYDLGLAQLNNVRTLSGDAADTMNFLTQFLGADGEKTYIIVSTTPAEARSSSGLIGSLGTVTTNNGKISMGEFYSSLKIHSQRGINKDKDPDGIFSKPLKMSFDLRDQDIFPDFETTSKGVISAWKNSGYSSGTIDGVIQADPVFMQNINKITGGFTTSTGVKLTGTDTAEYLQNTIYKTVSIGSQDQVFGEVASRSISQLFSNLTFSKISKIAQMLPQNANERHFQMSSTDKNVNTYLKKAGYNRAPQSSETAPTVGIYTNLVHASKLNWYLKRTTKITRTSCNPDGSQSYHIVYSMTNTLSQNDADSLSWYIVGRGKAGRGTALEKVLFYAPAGGTISHFVTTGNTSKLTSATLDGTKLQTSLATLHVGEKATYSFDVTTSTKAEEDLQLDQTPTTVEDSGITNDTSACVVTKNKDN